MEYDNTNTGALFRNDKKESDKHPDYKGQINVDGTEYWLSAWIKESKQGAKFMSLSIQPKDKAGNSGNQKSRPNKDIEEDIPF